jgi:hypothetical protein
MQTKLEVFLGNILHEQNFSITHYVSDAFEVRKDAES